MAGGGNLYLEGISVEEYSHQKVYLGLAMMGGWGRVAGEYHAPTQPTEEG